jgi:hypothetical protein
MVIVACGVECAVEGLLPGSGCHLLAVVGAGYIFGFVQALGPTVVSELFGLANFATNSAFVSTMFIASSFGIATTLTNWGYDRAANAQGAEACQGNVCFGPAFWICAVLGMFATLCSTILTVRKRKYYHRLDRCDFWAYISTMQLGQLSKVGAWLRCQSVLFGYIGVFVLQTVPTPLGCRIVQKERKKRGTAHKQHSQQQALQAMDMRLGRARTIIQQAYLDSKAMRVGLQPERHADGVLADLDKLGPKARSCAEHSARIQQAPSCSLPQQWRRVFMLCMCNTEHPLAIGQLVGPKLLL